MKLELMQLELMKLVLMQLELLKLELMQLELMKLEIMKLELMKLEISRRIFENTHISYHGNPSSGRSCSTRVDGHTDRHDEANNVPKWATVKSRYMVVDSSS